MTVYVLIRTTVSWDSELTEIIGIFTTRRKAEKALNNECELFPIKKWDNSAAAESIEYEISECTVDDYDFD